MNRRGGWSVVAVGAAILAALALVWAVDPAESDFTPPCPLHALTGLHCPGCGAGRALHALTHGRLVRALDLNPLMVLAVPFVVYGLASAASRHVRGRPLPVPRLPRWWPWGLLGVVVAYGVARNVPVWPLSVLAP